MTTETTELNGHYFKSPNTLFEYAENVYQIAVLSYLLRCRNNNTDQSFPSYKTIGDNCHISRYQAIRTVKALLALKLLEIIPTPYHTNKYIVTLSSQPQRLVNDSDQSTIETKLVNHSDYLVNHSDYLVNHSDPNKTKVTILSNNTKKQDLETSSIKNKKLITLEDISEVQKRYPTLDVEKEMEAFVVYCKGDIQTMSPEKLSEELTEWLDNTVNLAEAENKKSSKYTKGKYGFMVNRPRDLTPSTKELKASVNRPLR